MLNYYRYILAFLCAIVWATPVFAIDSALIREQHYVMVDNIKETWQLVWDKQPTPTCSFNDPDSVQTCPCSRFAYAQYGKLWLIRNRGTAEIERLDLGSLFSETFAISLEGDQATGSAILQRWPMKNKDHDAFFADSARDIARYARDVARRAAPIIMKFADYDHDGRATEFMILVDTTPCDHYTSAVVGISKHNPHLHAFTSVSHPEKPLFMPPSVWESLKQHRSQPVEVWHCGDHGSETQIDIFAAARNGQIDVKQLEYSCSADHSKLKEEPY